jgi:hypothetical protein
VNDDIRTAKPYQLGTFCPADDWMHFACVITDR